jgi:hypothetical protein
MSPLSPPPSSFVFALLLALPASLGCGASPHASPTAPQPNDATKTATAPQPTMAPRRAPEVSTMTPEQRPLVDTKLRAFGSGWALENLERRFTLAVTETPLKYEIRLTARGASGLWTVRHLLKEKTGLSGERLALPSGEELSPAQRSQADAILRQSKTVWLHQPSGRTAPIDLSKGIESLTEIDLTTATTGHPQRRTVTSRARDGFAVFYLKSVDPSADLFVVEVDLAARRIAEACWQDVPPNPTGMIAPEDIALVDAGMKRYGDFGVYGNVTAGLMALSKTSGIVITPSPTFISVSLGAEGGHDLSFRVDRKTGKLEGVAAGHSVGPDY